MDWNGLVQTFIQAAVPVILTAVIAALVQFARSKGIEISAQQQQQLEAIALRAVLKVEEQAKQVEKDAGAKVDSGTKQELAQAIVKRTLPKVADDLIHDAIKAALPVVGLGASGKAQPPKA